MSVKLESTIYFGFATKHPTTGTTQTADATPTCSIYEQGSLTKLAYAPTCAEKSDLDGAYHTPVAATAANGFEVDKVYDVFIEAVVGGVTQRKCIATFSVSTSGIDDLAKSTDTLDSNLVQIDGNPTNDNSATLTLKRLSIINDLVNGTDALEVKNTGTGNACAIISTVATAINVSNTGASIAAVVIQGDSGIYINSAVGHAINIESEGTGNGINITTVDGHGISVDGQGTGKKDIYAPDSNIGFEKNVTSITYNGDGTKNVITLADSTTITMGYTDGKLTSVTFG